MSAHAHISAFRFGTSLNFPTINIQNFTNILKIMYLQLFCIFGRLVVDLQEWSNYMETGFHA